MILCMYKGMYVSETFVVLKLYSKCRTFMHNYVYTKCKGDNKLNSFNKSQPKTRTYINAIANECYYSNPNIVECKL